MIGRGGWRAAWFVGLFVAASASAQTPSFPEVTGGRLWRYRAQMRMPEQPAVELTLYVRTADAPDSTARARRVTLELLTSEGRAFEAIVTRPLPDQLFVDRRGLRLAASDRAAIPPDFRRLRDPRTRRPYVVLAVSRPPLGCLTYDQPSPESGDSMTWTACLDARGVLRRFEYASVYGDLSFEGPVTVAADLAGSWRLAADPRDEGRRTFTAELVVDYDGRLSGSYVSASSGAPRCTLRSRSEDSVGPTVVDVACQAPTPRSEAAGADPRVGACSLELVGTRLAIGPGPSGTACPLRAWAPLERTSSPPDPFSPAAPAAPVAPVAVPVPARAVEVRSAVAPVVRTDHGRTTLDAGVASIACEHARMNGGDVVQCTLRGPGGDGVVVSSSYLTSRQFYCARTPVEFRLPSGDGDFWVSATQLMRLPDGGIRLRLAEDVVAWINPFMVSVELHTPAGAAHLDLPGAIEVGEAYTMETAFSSEFLATAFEVTDLRRPADYREVRGQRVSPCIDPSAVPR